MREAVTKAASEEPRAAPVARPTGQPLPGPYTANRRATAPRLHLARVATHASSTKRTATNPPIPSTPSTRAEAQCAHVRAERTRAHLSTKPASQRIASNPRNPQRGPLSGTWIHPETQRAAVEGTCIRPQTQRAAVEGTCIHPKTQRAAVAGTSIRRRTQRAPLVPHTALGRTIPAATSSRQPGRMSPGSQLITSSTPSPDPTRSPAASRPGGAAGRSSRAAPPGAPGARSPGRSCPAPRSPSAARCSSVAPL